MSSQITQLSSKARQRQQRKFRKALEEKILGFFLPLLQSGNSRPSNIVMFHIGRCGSSVLADLLNQHPEIFWDGEIYERYKVETASKLYLNLDPIKFLQTRMIRAGDKLYGFEFKFLEQHHLCLTKMKLSEYIERLQELGFNYFIVLERKNYLRMAISGDIHKINKKHNRPQHEGPELNQVKLEVGPYSERYPKSLVDRFYQYQESHQKLEELLSGNNLLKLTYEDDILVNPLNGYQQVCKFLNLDYHEVSIKRRKLNPFNLAEMIINFEEVEHALHGTPFEWMLGE